MIRRICAWLLSKVRWYKTPKEYRYLIGRTISFVDADNPSNCPMELTIVKVDSEMSLTMEEPK